MQTRQISPKKLGLRLLGALALTVAALFLLLLAAYAVPGGAVRRNIVRSVLLLQEEGLYPEYFGFKLFQMDNYTDTIMLFEAATADETDPLTAMMTNTTYSVDNFETMPDDLARYLAARADGGGNGGLQPFSYARYWHGYLIWLRPLLLFLTYGQIRVVQYLVLFVLLAAVLARLKKQAGWRPALWFAVSQLAVTVFFVPRQVQFFTTFLIAYAGCLWVLTRHRPAASLAVGLVVLGVCTAFCDLLVTPILTLGLPVAVWLVCLPQRMGAGPKQCAAVVGGSLCWGVGYGVCWAAKWVIASLVTGQDIIGDALHQASVRTTADTWHGIELTWGNILRFVYDTLAGRGLFWPLMALLALGAAAFCLCLRSRDALLRALPLGLTALMAPVWLAALRTHSIQHGWFTWRALAPSVFAGLAFVYYACSLRAGRRRLFKRSRDRGKPQG